ncbi:MAG: hypothetical protein L0Y58_00285 [Verrucomicrobia subdivision 3 bacterium]|nr:hypothetical protein [Limisphaerales bacterium]
MNDRLEQFKLRREEFASEREQLIHLKLELSGRYDQWVLTLSGGALAVSLTFLERIASSPGPETMPYLVTAWACLILALLSGVLGLILSQYAVGGDIKRLDWHFCRDASRLLPQTNPPPTQSEPKNRFTKVVHAANILSIAGFLTGITFLCMFSYDNIGTNQAAAAPPAALPVAARERAPMPAIAPSTLQHNRTSAPPATAGANKQKVVLKPVQQPSERNKR